MSDTIFSRIIKGEIPCVRLYEDELCIVILDVNPVSKGHSLVICKSVLPTTAEVPDEVLSHMIVIAKRVSARMKETLSCDATNIIINNGSAAGQEVPQLHIHVIPRFQNDGLKPGFTHTRYEENEMLEFGKTLELK